MSKTRHILSLSGGKDSTALALYMRDRVPEMEYVFCDTGEELTETYEYLNLVESYLGKKIIRLNAKAGFKHWLKVYGGYLPGPRMRWCTKQLKLKPFEKYIGDEDVISYVGIRYDEDRTGYISGKDNITTVYPFKEDKIKYKGVMRILKKSGIGMPPYMDWGRTHSGCYFCFFQRKIEWVRLLEKYPDDFDKAQAFEKLSSEMGKTYTWIEGLPLAELRKKEKIQEIKENHRIQVEQLKKKRGNKKLVEILAGMEEEEYRYRACLICQL
ncbi:MAG: phosphoadenosine phosphosulfate reductase family protein [Desulfobacter sp.]